MPAVLGALIVTTLHGPSQAIERMNTPAASCASIQSALIDQGAAILRYPSKRSGQTLYDRYVGDSRRCETGKVGDWASVPAKDNPRCRVIACETYDADDLFPQSPFVKPWLRLRVTG
jgi:hypothetical protein